MGELIIYVLVTLLSGVAGAWVGTYCGAFFSAHREEKRKKDMRNIAIKGLNIIKKYSVKGNSYDVAEAEFNNLLSVAEKRAFVVALHKLGVPIMVTSTTKFNIQCIRFEKIMIDKDELTAIINQVELGYCDQLFYIDPETYFNDNIRLRTLRSISKRWVEEVFAKSIIDRENKKIYYSDKWFERFTLAERFAIAVFKEKIGVDEYFADNCKIKEGAIKEICSDIDRGLWDNCFYWDIENYNNVTAANSLNVTLTQILNNQKEMVYPPEQKNKKKF